jgi:hypothetical protein
LRVKKLAGPPIVKPIAEKYLKPFKIYVCTDGDDNGMPPMFEGIGSIDPTRMPHRNLSPSDEISTGNSIQYLTKEITGRPQTGHKWSENCSTCSNEKHYVHNSGKKYHLDTFFQLRLGYY